MTTYGSCVPPTSAEPQPLLLDTSAAVPLVIEAHEAHEATFAALADLPLGLAGHAAFETVSVLTRLPAPSRLAPVAALQVLQSNFPHTRFLSESGAARLFAELAQHGVAGGSVYDALVGATALEHELVLVSRDRRASAVYRSLGVVVRLLD